MCPAPATARHKLSRRAAAVRAARELAAESGFMPARRRYAGYLDDADGAKIGDGQVQVA